MSDLAGLPGEFTRPGSERSVAFIGGIYARATIALGVWASLAFFPLVVAQGTAVRRRLPSLPPPAPPHHGLLPGEAPLIRLLAIGESTVAGVGLKCGDETVASTTARSLSTLTHRGVAWRAEGLSGATAGDGLKQLLPRLEPEPADLIIIAFSVNDVIGYRSPAAFANDLLNLVVAARHRVGNAAVVIAGIAPIFSFPALPWPLRTILGWRSAALQFAANRLERDLSRVSVERFSQPLEPDLFAPDGFHPNVRAHALWGEEIAALAMPLLACQ
jgi:lysophospholipase L1-like esterase